MTSCSIALESKYAALRLSEAARDKGYENNAQRRQFGAYERRYLKQAEAYFWTHQIADAVLTSSRSLPSDTRLSLAAYQDKQAGWFWFEHPIRCEGFKPFCAVLWRVGDVDDALDGDRPKRCLTISTYCQTTSGPEVSDTVFLEDMVSLDRIDSDDKKFDAPAVATLAQQLHIADEIRRPGAAAPLFSFMLATLLWIEQRIVVASGALADRASRRRLARSGEDAIGALNVITLRRRSCDGTNAGGAHVEWSCQWVVRGHWRQQFYPSTEERRPLFILPYVKGPEDKPLKAPEATVFTVTR